MKTFKNLIFASLLFLTASAVFSQSKLTGYVTDVKLGGTLPGATITVKGTKSSVIADFDGKFLINTTVNSGQLVITFVGYDSKTINFTTSGSSTDVGTIGLVSSNELEEIVVKSTIVDIAKDRKTPVAVSTIKAAEIQQKLGNLEFPEILANTPSVYVTRSGGGFGDSRINIRGFDQKNIAVMINGVPVNDMENGSVYWSNWAGLSDVTSFMQVQRGLGSSKLAIASVGGTINVVTKTSDMKEGGVVSVGVANDNYLKTLAAYNTGKMKNGLSASILLSQTQGSTFADGTKFQGGNYYIALGYEINKKNDIQFTFTGAPQYHNQRSFASTIANYIKYGDPANNEPNIRYNSDWGTLNGQEYSFRTNYYHKPVMSLNWDYKINESTKLSSVVYGSWGRGAGSNGSGAIRGNQYTNANLRKADGTIDVDLIQAYNSGQTVVIPGSGPSTRALTAGSYQNVSSNTNNLTNGISKTSNYNSHNWYGAVINLDKKINKYLTLDFGVDLRTYKGFHYQNLNDLLGATNFKDVTTPTSGNLNDPNRVVDFQYSTTPSINPFLSADYQTKIGFNNDGDVNWYGAFSQLEYSNDRLTAYVQGAISQQGFKRVDYFKYLDSNPLQSTGYKNLLGGNAKVGVNYNISESSNFYVNSGYYSKQPFLNAVYPNNANITNENLTNEKILGFEAGYGFKVKGFTANLNVYRTSWKDRYQRTNDADPTNAGGYYDFLGISEIHQGAELEFTATPFEALQIKGMVSYGDWFYNGNVTSNRFDQTNNNISGGTSTTLYLDKVKVGDAAQSTAAIGATYTVVKNVKIDGNYRFQDRLFASISPNTFASPTNKGSLQLPSYGLVDAGFSYRLLVGKTKSNSVNFRANVNNLLNKIYIAESRTNIFTDDFVTGSTGPTYDSSGKTYNGVANANQVYFGFGRTWNFTINYNF